MGKSMKDQSRLDWEDSTGKEYIGDERIKLGCLMRIADATEKMAVNHISLMAERDVYLRWYNESCGRERKANRRIAGLKGCIKRLKKAKGLCK